MQPFTSIVPVPIYNVCVTSFHLTSIANLGLFAWCWFFSPRKGAVWCSACIGVGMSLVMEFAHGCPMAWIDDAQYGSMKWACDIGSAAVDASVFCCLVREVMSCTPARLLTVACVAWFLLVKLHLQWYSDPYDTPYGYVAYLQPLKVWSSWALLGAYAWTVYCDGRAECSEEKA